MNETGRRAKPAAHPCCARVSRKTGPLAALMRTQTGERKTHSAQSSEDTTEVAACCCGQSLSRSPNSLTERLTSIVVLLK